MHDNALDMFKTVHKAKYWLTKVRTSESLLCKAKIWCVVQVIALKRYAKPQHPRNFKLHKMATMC